MGRRKTAKKRTTAPDLEVKNNRVRSRIQNSIQSQPLPTNFQSILNSASASHSQQDFHDTNEIEATICRICSKELIPVAPSKSIRKSGPKSKTRMLILPPVEAKDHEKLVDMLNFVAVDCLGQEGTEGQIKGDSTLCGPVDDYFCEDHMKMVLKAMEIDKLVRNMMQELEDIKEALRKDVRPRNHPASSHEDIRRRKKRRKSKMDSNELDATMFLEVGIKLEKCDAVATGEEGNSILSNVDEVDFDFCEIAPQMCNSLSPVQQSQSNLKEVEEKNDSSSRIRNKRRRPVQTSGGPPTGSQVDIKTEPEDFDDISEDYSSHPTPLDSLNDSNGEDGEQISEPSKKMRLRACRKSASKLSEEQNATDVHRTKLEVRKKPKSTPINEKRIKKAKSASRTGRKKVVAGAKTNVPTAKRKSYCQLCPKSFRTAEECKSHTLDVHGPGPYFDCSQCCNRYKHKFDLKTHIQRRHGNLQKSFTCNKCPQSYSTLIDLKHHAARRHSSSSNEILICPYCTTGKRYKGKINLAAHIRNLHKGHGLPRKHLVCEFCAQPFSNGQAFQKHREKEHLNVYQKVSCDICGRQLSDARSLLKHKMSQHSKSFQYKCQLCGSGSLFKSHLIAHYKTTHASLSPEELDELIQNSKKILDNTNPIYWKKQGEEEAKPDEDKGDGTVEPTKDGGNIPNHNHNLAYKQNGHEINSDGAVGHGLQSKNRMTPSEAVSSVQLSDNLSKQLSNRNHSTTLSENNTMSSSDYDILKNVPPTVIPLPQISSVANNSFDELITCLEL